MADINYIKSINDRITNIEKTISSEDSFELSKIIKSTVTYQLIKINKIKKSINKKVQSTKDSIKKLYKAQKKKIQNILSSSIHSILDNKCMKSFMNTIKSIFSNTKNILKGIKNKFIGLMKSVFDILSSIKTFIMDKIQSSFVVVNKLLYGIPGKTWTLIKFAFKFAYKVFNWTLKLGKMALDFIWSGVKTIFNVGVSAISTSISYLTKGSKAFFSWWFKMLINTMLNPAMWIINIPLFAIITTIAFTAFGLVLATVSSVFLPILETTFDVLSVVGGWIYDGISWLFTWLQSAYNGSFLQTQIVDPSIKWIKDNIPTSIKKVYGTVLEWSNIAYDWINSTGSSYLTDIQQKYSDLKKWYTEAPGKTLFQKIINKLMALEYTVMGFTFSALPNQLKLQMKRVFGFVLSSEVGSDSISAYLKENTTYAEKKLVEHTIELQYAKLSKQNIPEAEIKKILESQIIPNLKNTLVANLDSKTIETATATGIQNAKSALENKMKFIDENFVGQEIKALSDLMFMKKQIEQGDLNAASPELIRELRKSISDKTYAIEVGEGNFRTSKTVKLEDNIGQYLKDVKDSLDTASVLTSVKTVQENLDQYKGFIGKVNNIALLIANVNKLGYGEETTALSTFYSTPAPLGLKSAVSRIAPKAHGDIMIPNKTEMSKTIALDNRGIDFIRSKVKEIVQPLNKNTKENEEATNITIIEEHNNYSDSYEIYTMNQLSKGILRN